MYITEIPGKIQLKSTALDKMRAYSKLTNQLHKKNSECYGFVLNSVRSGNLVVEDVNLAHNQSVSASHASVCEGLFDTRAEMENNGYQAIGCWHSHHDMGAWHSGTDDRNLEALVARLAQTRVLKNQANNHDCVRSNAFGTLQVSNAGVPLTVLVGLRGCEWEYHAGMQTPPADVFDMYDVAIQYKSGFIGIKVRKNRVEKSAPLKVTYSADKYEIRRKHLKIDCYAQDPYKTQVLPGAVTLENHTCVFLHGQTHAFQSTLFADTLTSIAYSIVVSKDDVYAQQCLMETSLVTKKCTVRREEVGMDIVPAAGFIDEDLLRRHVNERVKS